MNADKWWSFSYGIKCRLWNPDKPTFAFVEKAVRKHPEMIISTAVYEFDTNRVLTDPDEIQAKQSIGETMDYTTVSTKNGNYIGGIVESYQLSWLTRFESGFGGKGTVSIGFDEKEQKWYGWSHRAMFGFGIGSTVKPGDVAYQPSTRELWAIDLAKFYEFPEYEFYENNTKLRLFGNGKLSMEEDVPTEFGKGEWTAETQEDAKQMAMDFAMDVS